MRTHPTILTIAATTAAIILAAPLASGQSTDATLSPQALQDIAQVEAEIDRIEAQTIERLAAPPDNRVV